MPTRLPVPGVRSSHDWSDRVDVVPYDGGPRPDGHRPPARPRPRRLGGHAFWERLPFPVSPGHGRCSSALVCFGLWFLLDAPSLQHSAQTSPLGTRRTVSLDVVGPVAALSRTFGLSSWCGWTDRALGREPGRRAGTLAVPIRRPRRSRRRTTTSGTTTRPPCPPLNYHPDAGRSAEGARSSATPSDSTSASPW